MKVAVVITYFERQHQLTQTLLSMQASACNDFEVIIIDDCSPNDIVLPPLRYQVYVHKLCKKAWHNPEPAYNIGISHALRRGAEIIIVQNAECYHVGDVISRASMVQQDEYISFGCFSINERATFAEHDIGQLVRANNFGASHDGQNAWYNHPQHRPVGYDFCAAMQASTMRALNGYDERLSDGMAYGDDYLLQRVRMLGLRFEITATPFVVHQWHYTGLGVPENKAELVERNRILFYKLLAEHNPRAQHLYTEDFENTFNKSVAG